MVKTLCFHCRGHGFHPWSGELRSHIPCCIVKTKKKKKIEREREEKAFMEVKQYFRSGQIQDIAEKEAMKLNETELLECRLEK